jgi:hypothetical protein
MKKLFVLALLICSMMVRAQVYTITDFQSAQKLESYSLNEVKNTYLVSNYTSIKFSDRFGTFVFLSADAAGYKDIAPGFLYSSDSSKKKHYWELGLGAGATLAKDPAEKTAWYGQLYAWFETKPEELVAKGKWIMQINPAYTFQSDEPYWLQGYVMYGVTKHIDIGAYFQSYSAKGARLGLNLPIGESTVFRLYGVVGEGTMLGTSFIAYF